jgi:hypothetical protein
VSGGPPWWHRTPGDRVVRTLVNLLGLWCCSINPPQPAGFRLCVLRNGQRGMGAGMGMQLHMPHAAAGARWRRPPLKLGKTQHRQMGPSCGNVTVAKWMHYCRSLPGPNFLANKIAPWRRCGCRRAARTNGAGVPQGWRQHWKCFWSGAPPRVAVSFNRKCTLHKRARSMCKDLRHPVASEGATTAEVPTLEALQNCVDVPCLYSHQSLHLSTVTA